MAGTGKSTIALTICRKYAKVGRLGASFFFSRGNGDLASAGKVAITIAAQLADAVSELQKHIKHAVASNPRILDLGLYDQWDKLVVKPLAQLDKDTFPLPIVIVVDALDECDDEKDVALLLQCLNAATIIEGSPLRVFVTSRPEQPINFGFNRILRDAHQDFVLHNIEDSIVNEDLMLFYKDRLSCISEQFKLEDRFLSDETIQALVAKSSRLFIHAATVCRFIEDGKTLANKRLSELVAAGGAPLKPEKELDRMYLTVLNNSVSTHLDADEVAKQQNLFKNIIGSIVVLFDIMTFAGLAILLSEPGDDIIRMLQSLHSVLDIPEEETSPVRLLHPSFRDFLLDPVRCDSQRFSVNAKATHRLLFNNCLRLMKEHLRRNMCKLTHPGFRARDVSKADVDKCIPLPVQYACRHFVHHLQQSDVDVNEHPDIVDFFNTQLLYWLEALSLLNQLSEGITMIRLLETMLSSFTVETKSLVSRVKMKWRQNTVHTHSLSQTVHDTIRFLLDHRSVIEEAPLQTYCSAILFSPENSIIRKLYLNQVPQWIISRPITFKNWGPCLQILAHSGSVNAVTFSPNGQLIASASDDGTVRLWDTATGREQRVFKGHSGWVNAVIFSPNGQLIASASDDETVRLWDIATGEQRALKGHLGSVEAVIFSPNGQLIASASDDKTVRLWDTATGREQRAFKGHLGSVNAVTFSPNGQLIASASNDKTVRLWDTATGREQRALKGHLGSVKAVTFSPNGQLIASASDDGTVRLWDTATGREQRVLKGHLGWVKAVTFSPNGQLIASASNDETVRLWDTATGREQRALKGHLGSVKAVTFSPNGQLIASASDDKTVRLWDTATGREQRALKSHLGSVKAVTFSPNGQLIASASYDGTVRLWDTATGREQRALKGHLGSVKAVTFSPNGQLIASASYDKTVRLWDTATGDFLQSIGVGIVLSELSFDPDNQSLLTNAGALRLTPITTYSIGKSSTTPLIQTLSDHNEERWLGYGISRDCSWITFKGENLFRLPVDCQSETLAVFGSTVAIGTRSGRIVIIRFSLEDLTRL
ncbi:putative WD-repeat protein [Xylariaceae sp. FL1651]|nr:putative WD-repeat protein [Xylariaceae sp. FL1651]